MYPHHPDHPEFPDFCESIKNTCEDAKKNDIGSLRWSVNCILGLAEAAIELHCRLDSIHKRLKEKSNG